MSSCQHELHESSIEPLIVGNRPAIKAMKVDRAYDAAVNVGFEIFLPRSTTACFQSCLLSTFASNYLGLSSTCFNFF